MQKKVLIKVVAYWNVKISKSFLYIIAYCIKVVAYWNVKTASISEIGRNQFKLK